jgi:hypothetical protein
MGNNFVHRRRSRDGYLADFPVLNDDYFAVEEAVIPNIGPMLAMVGAQSPTPTPRLEDSTAHCLRSRRHNGPAAYQAGAEHIPGRGVIQLTAAFDATDEPEMASGTANVGLPVGSSGHPLPRCLSANCTVRVSERPSTS